MLKLCLFILFFQTYLPFQAQTNQIVYPEPISYSYAEYFSELQKNVGKSLNPQENMLNRLYPLFRTYREEREMEKHFCQANQLTLPDENAPAPFFRLPQTLQDYDNELRLTTSPWTRKDFPDVYQWCEEIAPFISQLEAATECSQFAFVFTEPVASTINEETKTALQLLNHSSKKQLTQQISDMRTGLEAYAQLKINENNIDEAWRICRLFLRFAQIFERQNSIQIRMTGGSFARSVDRMVSSIVEHSHTDANWYLEKADELSAGIAFPTLQPLIDTDFEDYPGYLTSSVAELSQSPEKIDRYLDLFQERTGRQLWKTDEQKARLIRTIDWQKVIQIGVQWRQRETSAVIPDDWVRTIFAINEIRQEFMAWGDNLFNNKPFEVNSMFAFVCINDANLLPSQLRDQLTVHRQLNISRLFLMIKALYQKKGRLPESLNELVSELTTTYPKDFFKEYEIFYEKITDHEFRIFYGYQGAKVPISQYDETVEDNLIVPADLERNGFVNDEI